MRAPVTDVAACVVRAPDGRVLVTERTAGQVSPGYWELPAGKIEPGESAAEAAARELAEETGVRALRLRPWARYEHAFPLRRIRLHCFLVEHWEGSPQGREGQRIAWVDPAFPGVAPILPSVVRVLAALGLPAVCALCGPAEHGGVAQMLGRIVAAARDGVRLFQLREPGLSPDQRVSLARRASALVTPFRARVLLAGSTLECRRAGAAGIYSTAPELRRLSARPPVSLWICACDDERDLARAIEFGADAAVVAPLRDADGPGERATAWGRLRDLIATVPLPLYAEAPPEKELIAAARGAGAIGIATDRWFAASTRTASTPVVEAVAQ